MTKENILVRFQCSNNPNAIFEIRSQTAIWNELNSIFFFRFFFDAQTNDK